MRRGAWAAIAGMGVLGAGLIVFAATRPVVRETLTRFISPIPLATAGPAPSEDAAGTLFTETVLKGGESRELGKLRAAPDTAPGPAEGKSVARSPRLALFPSTPRKDMPAANRVTALKRPDIIQRDDARIEAFMQYWLRDERGHAALVAAYQRSGRYAPTIERILGAWKVPDSLSALAFLESGYVPSAAQPDGSAGLWSLPMDVSDAYGLNVREKYDERRGVESSTEVAGRYLADLKERLGSWSLAIYAFAHGYKKTVDELGKLHSLTFEDVAPDLTPGDVTYVFQTFALATIVANPGRFGLDGVHQDAAQLTSDLEVPPLAPMTVIARSAGTTLGILHELNPEYLGDVVPSTGSAMIVHLPREGLARAKEMLTPMLYDPTGRLYSQAGVAPDADAGAAPKGHKRKGDKRAKDEPAGAAPTTPSPAGPSSFYRVHEGDTLDAIAGRLGVARETIAGDNALDPTATLTTGQLLRIRKQ